MKCIWPNSEAYILHYVHSVYLFMTYGWELMTDSCYCNDFVTQSTFSCFQMNYQAVQKSFLVVQTG